MSVANRRREMRGRDQSIGSLLFGRYVLAQIQAKRIRDSRCRCIVVPVLRARFVVRCRFFMTKLSVVCDA